jgi:hypothetical protein
MHGNKWGKPRVIKKKEMIDYIKPKIKVTRSDPRKSRNRKSMFSPSIKDKEKVDRYSDDEVFYEKCFNTCSEHTCEECATGLSKVFRGDDGKVVNKSRYSHIIPKSIASHLRHEVDNINHLCFDCHQKWDFGDKTKMKIYEKNKKRYPKFF